jgi:phage baseplate assembly protein gpV
VRRVQGVVVGLVRDIDDPLGEGRVRVQYPWFEEGVLSGWAPIARTMAGKERGFYYMPELEDEALVAFEHGDFNHPFVIGFLHNGVDLPPDDDINAKVRRVKTVSGHVLEFDDRASRERVLLETQGGHRLVMEDAPGTVELATTGGQRLKMQDTPGQITLSTPSGSNVTINDLPSSIQVTTAGGVTLVVSDAGGVTISAPAGMLNITCLNATISASASCTVNAPVTSINSAAVSINSGLATFSGVVQCATLITNAVVSSSYTPGAGNIW